MEVRVVMERERMAELSMEVRVVMERERMADGRI